MKVLDQQIEFITGPLLKPIIDLYRFEGAPFISDFNNTTPFSFVAQGIVVEGDYLLPSFGVNDIKESS